MNYANLAKLCLLTLVSAALVVPAQASTRKKIKKADYEATSEAETTITTGERTARSDYAIAFHVGPNFTVASLDTTGVSPNTSGATRLMMGAAFEARLGEYFFAQPELNYVQRGASSTITGAANASATLNTDLDYMEIPLLIKAKYAQGAIHPYGVFGPSLAFLIGKGMNTTINGKTSNVPQDTLDNSFKSVVFALNIGTGVDIALTKRFSAVADLRYSLSLSNALSNTDQNANTSLKNSGFQMLTGMQYAL